MATSSHAPGVGASQPRARLSCTLSAALLYEGPSWALAWALSPAALALHSLGCDAPTYRTRARNPALLSRSGSSLLLLLLRF